MVAYNDIGLKETRFYQDVFSEGFQEGLKDAQHEGEIRIILRLLKRRFNNLHANTIIRIQQLNSVQLEALADKMFDFTMPSELDAWLEQI